MAMRRIALIKGPSQYGLLRFFIDDAARAFQMRGYQTVVLDALAVENDLEIYRQLRDAAPLDLVLTIGIFGASRDEFGRSIFEATGTPHVIQYVDHPLHHRNRLVATARDSALLFIDRSHVRAVSTLYGDDRFAYFGFGPHAAQGEPVTLPADAETYESLRPIPFLFAGTVSPLGPYPWEGLPSSVEQVFTEAAEIAAQVETVSCLELVDQVFAHRGLDPNGPGVSKSLSTQLLRVRELAIYVHEWIRIQRRARLLEAAGEAGIPLTLVGNGTERYAGRYKSFDCRGQVDFREATALMQQSRVILNCNANFGEGSHERSLTAMLAGAVAATATSTFYTDNFVKDRDLFLFRWTHLKEDMAALADIVRDRDRLFAMARAGQQQVMAHHCWEHRIDTFLAAAQAVRDKYGRTNPAEQPAVA